MTEQLKYEVVKRFPDFEIRRYQDYSLVRVQTTGEFKQASFNGFYPLLKYISGGNQLETKIAMTAPVLQEPKNTNEHVISFVLPESVSPQSVPAPKDDKLEIRLIPSHDVAAIKFRGSWSAESMQEKGKKLVTALAREKVETKGSVYYARFDPPWKPPFIRHNEALIDLKSSFEN